MPSPFAGNTLLFILSGLSYFQTLCGEATVLATGSSPRFLTDVLQRGKIPAVPPDLDGTHTRLHAKEL
jgi:hypothetical protein